MLNIYQFPKIENWQIFEDMIFDICNQKYLNMPINFFGRQGQKQEGIDIYVNNENYKIGIQVKNYTKLTLTQVDEFINNVNIDLDTLVLAISINTDAKIMKKIKEKQKTSNFQIQIWFWENIINDLINFNLISKYYPMVDNFAINKDRELFIEFDKDFIKTGFYSHWKGDVSRICKIPKLPPIHDDIISLLCYFEEKWDLPLYEFREEKIEKLKIFLIDGIKEFNNVASVNMWCDYGDYYQVPIEWKNNAPQRYENVLRKLCPLAIAIEMNLDSIIQEGKKLRLF